MKESVTAITYCNGHQLNYIDDEWYLESTGELYTSEISKLLKCTKCNQLQTKDGHDNCIKNLPNVKFACCGHGIKNYAYICYNNGVDKKFTTTEDLHKYLENKNK